MRCSEPLAGALIGAACALAVILFAPPSQDLAAHVYRASLVSHGVLLWDNYWYTGTYPLVTYSVLAPVISAVVGVAALVVGCTAAAGALFASISVREWGRDARWPARAFAAAAALPLLPGLDAYVLGVPLLLAAVAALQRGRRVLALVCSALTLAASPLAFLFLVGVVTAVFLSGRGAWRTRAVVGGGLAALAALEAIAMLVVFPGVGVYPFLVWHLVAVGGLACAGTLLGYRDQATRPIALLLSGWGLVCLASFLVANPVGDNVARLRYAVFPLLLLLAVRRRGRGIASIVAAAALVYAAAPDLIQVGEQADASSARASPGRRPSRTCATTCRLEPGSRSYPPRPAGRPTTCRPAASRWRADGSGRPTWPATGCSIAAAHALGVRPVAGALRSRVRRADALSARRSRCRQRGPPAAPARLGSARRVEARRASRSSRRLTERS